MLSSAGKTDYGNVRTVTVILYKLEGVSVVTLFLFFKDADWSGHIMAPPETYSDGRWNCEVSSLKS